MIQKIKELMQIKELLDDVSTKCTLLSNNMKSMSEDHQRVQQELAQVKQEQQQFLSSFRENMAVVGSLKEDFKKEVYDFTLLKNEIQKKVLQRFDERLEQELVTHLEGLKQQETQYQEIKRNIIAIVRKMSEVSMELNKFVVISKAIKEHDFALTKTASKISQVEKEKMELVQKIDALERLIAKMRRR